ncbi:hypothetical protein KUCAC02_020434 [Chaenocephalus aceratus]|nr:hypothetical protein KUCAC02_020434 [Chaenocephalus aceratus]
MAALSRQHSHGSTITAALSRQHYHGSTITAALSRQHSHGSTITAALSRQHSHGNTITAALSRQHSHGSTITAALSRTDDCTESTLCRKKKYGGNALFGKEEGRRTIGFQLMFPCVTASLREPVVAVTAEHHGADKMSTEASLRLRVLAQPCQTDAVGKYSFAEWMGQVSVIELHCQCCVIFERLFTNSHGTTFRYLKAAPLDPCLGASLESCD